MPRRTPAMALVAIVLLAAPAAAQGGRSIHTPPPRPALWADADTADANTYYNLGARNLAAEPRLAADAFYWAYRLRPGWADALYGRRVALLMASPDRLVRYMEGSRSVARAPDVLAIDSLYVRALTLDPFLFRKFDRDLLQAYFRRVAERAIRAGGEGVDQAEVDNWIRGMFTRLDPETQGMRAYAEGRFPDAITAYERAARGSRSRSRTRTELARVRFLSGDMAGAMADLGAAIEEMRKEDASDLVYVYESKAVLEHSVAAIHERRGEAEPAREAYGRALQEDLSYYPAHVRLASLSLAAGDTAAAVSGMDLAVQIAEGDGALRYDYASLLVAARKYVEALEHLKKAAELEPYYAAPHLLLGKIHDASGMRLEAVQNYRDFLARASRGDAQRAWAQGRLAALEAGLQAETAGTQAQSQASPPSN